ncbi:NADH-quinone oxidoreductase subunit NuoG [Marinicella rhabdoformis]|uniref:NADH-quinone oxidoreductase subunit NuoG n=1 Tax=Marinicella rhabdoformis TaxID=2580566 RepID=UPI0012AED7FF|nr:NADH-quinone oxidoreductase subunit NuoG [Marinicella rhabdoformis]
MSDGVKQADNMISIEIDGQALQAERGSMIIEAADQAGIKIPRFCYHKKLSVAANCRMCMVDVEKAPKPMPACATPVMPDMKIYTQSKRATDAQRNVMEFLLINHPLDCPICDQGGECELQDVSMGYGRDVSRYVDTKRVVKDENLGSLISTDMTRCILCTRCVRFLNEVAGTDELGGIGRGDRTNISTAVGRSVDSEMSGNVIDLCPVGALTNKPFRYKARAWELMATSAVSMHDAVGSNMYYHTRNGDILRAVPQDNDDLNEAWLSDRDRYGIHGLKDATDRVTTPQIKENGVWKDISWEDALATLVDQIKAASSDDLALFAGNHATTEEYVLLKQLFDGLGSHNYEHRIHATDLSQHDRLPRVDLTLPEVADQNSVVMIGAYPRHEQPILNHKLRQAWLKGAKISSITAKKQKQNFDLLHDYVGNQLDWVKALASLAHCVADIKGEQPTGELGVWVMAQKTDEDLNHLAKQLLKEENNNLFILGQTAESHPQASMIKATTAWLSQVTNGKVYETVRGANAVGASMAGLSFDGNLLDKAHKVNVLYQAELQDFANPADAKQALINSDFSVAMNAFADEDLKSRVDMILPIALLPETSGTLVNNLNQRQESLVAQRSPGETKPGWRVLRVLGTLLELSGFDYQDVNDVMAVTEKMSAVEGIINQDVVVTEPEVKGLVLLANTAIYDVDALTRRSKPLQETVLASSDTVYVNPADMASIGFTEGDMVAVEQDGRFAEMTLSTCDFVSAGSAQVSMGRRSSLKLNANDLSISIIGAQS